MMVFDLQCRSGGHRFEGWFASSGGFADQQERGLIACPVCGSAEVERALSAPRLGRKGNQGVQARAAPRQEVTLAAGKLPPEAVAVAQALARMQQAMLKDSRWVGERFAEDARAMHYGERDVATIHGQATLDEAKALVEEGVMIAPLPFPVAPPEELN